jgi:hypothetical protein
MSFFVAFDKNKGSKQKLPAEGELVLVQLAPRLNSGMPSGVAVGFLRYAAGNKNNPYFVVPGLHNMQPELAWCDCLPAGFRLPI